MFLVNPRQSYLPCLNLSLVYARNPVALFDYSETRIARFSVTFLSAYLGLFHVMPPNRTCGLAFKQDTTQE